MYYIRNSSTAVPFQMRQVEENISFLEYTSPSHLEEPSLNDKYTTNPSTVYVTKKQLDVVEYITKFTEHYFIIIHTLMNIPGNTAFLRLITFNYKITINQSDSNARSHL